VLGGSWNNKRKYTNVSTIIIPNITVYKKE
jgi:hypothetical protein